VIGFDDIAVDEFDIIVALSPEALEKVRVLTRHSSVDVEYWPTEDPTAESGGSRESRLQAYRNVRDGLRRRIEGRSAVHDSTYNSAGIMRRGMKEVTDPREAPGARHPLIVVHPDNGRETLLLGRRRNGYILGLSLAESEALLDELWAHACQPQFAFRQEWQVGDVILWDNRSTLHRRDSFDPASRRRMHRTQIKGAALKAAA
jgi:alpha-ketoglutarate-dependent taurine dioxygenase